MFDPAEDSMLDGAFRDRRTPGREEPPRPRNTSDAPRAPRKRKLYQENVSPAAPEAASPVATEGNPVPAKVEQPKPAPVKAAGAIGRLCRPRAGHICAHPRHLLRWPLPKQKG
jgi:hypothetical protein